MLCQKCKQAEATSHIRSVVGGVVRDSYLCAECAAKVGNAELYDGIFKIFSSLMGGEKEAEDTPRCDCCKMSFNEISRTGRVGCARCYKFFEKQLEPAIAKIHKTTVHVGKKPVRPETAEKTAENDTVAELKKQLKEAVEKEEYERAAVLRDEIKRKESGE